MLDRRRGLRGSGRCTTKRGQGLLGWRLNWTLRGRPGRRIRVGLWLGERGWGLSRLGCRALQLRAGKAIHLQLGFSEPFWTAPFTLVLRGRGQWWDGFYRPSSRWNN